MPITWTDKLDKKLLLEFIHQNDLKSKNWPKVVEGMGEGYSVAACQQRFTKIRSIAGFGTAPKNAEGQSSDVTPVKKPSKAGTPRKRAAEKRKRGSDSPEDSDFDPTPSKKKNVGKTKAAPVADEKDAAESESTDIKDEPEIEMKVEDEDE